MDEGLTIRHGIDLLDEIFRNHEAIWGAFSIADRIKVELTLQQFKGRAEAAQSEPDTERRIVRLVELASDCIELVRTTPALLNALFPGGEVVFPTPVILGVSKDDLGDTENQRNANAQRCAAQISNAIVNLQHAASGMKPNDAQQKKQQKARL